jgi:hypothetical protein
VRFYLSFPAQCERTSLKINRSQFATTINGGYMKSNEIFSTVFAKAKDQANEMTLHNTRVKRLVKQKKIEK